MFEQPAPIERPEAQCSPAELSPVERSRARRSQAQRAAARTNGARSRGPRSAEGKARASRNAWKHGLRATVHLLAPDEDPEEFQALAHDLAREWHDPRPSRALLLERLAAAVWKLRRAERLEAALHALPPRPAPGWIGPDPGLPTALTRLPEYATLLRHQSQLERFLLRALRSLERPPDDDAFDPYGPDPEGPELPEPHPAGPRLGSPEPTAAPFPAEASIAAADAAPAGPDGSDPETDAAPFAAGPDAAEAAHPRSAAGDRAADTDPRSREASGADEAPAGGGEPAGLAGLARACAERLLRQGRVREAARLARFCRAPAARPGADEAPPAPEPIEAILARELADATPEERAEWDSLGYDRWVVPPGCGRRPMASLDAEWICPADRWRLLEELRRLGDPEEEARVLDHFARAGLDPGADHPAFAGRVPPPAAAAPQAPSAAPEPARPARNPLWIRLGLEAEAYHGAGRARRAAEAWRRHARELGVPVPPHAGLAGAEAAAETHTRASPGVPPVDLAPGDDPAPPPAAFAPRPAPRPCALAPSSWPWAPEDGLVRADGTAFRVRPA